eukprot:1675164-Rhodomonas_salina.1
MQTVFTIRLFCFHQHGPRGHVDLGKSVLLNLHRGSSVRLAQPEHNMWCILHCRWERTETGMTMRYSRISTIVPSCGAAKVRRGGGVPSEVL